MAACALAVALGPGCSDTSTGGATGGSAGSSTTFANQSEADFSDLPAYEGVEFADDLHAEQQRLASALAVDEVTGTTTGDFAGAFTNVVDGVRDSLDADCAGCPAATLWLTGGSAAFGLGQRDEHTIASELVRLAGEDGIALEVQNLAVPGWTLSSERAAVAQRLAAGEPPDGIVSYTGFNDVAANVVEAIVGEPDPDEPAVLDPEVIARFAAEGGTLDDAGGLIAVRDLAVGRAQRELGGLRAAASAAGVGFTTAFFQPDALASQAQFEPVREVYRGLPPGSEDDLDAALEAVSSAMAPEVVDLRHLYDGEASVFVDWSHTNEVGAQLAAAAIYERIRAEVRAVAD